MLQPLRKLIGTDVGVLVSDPWEFCSAHGNGPFGANVVDVGSNEWEPGTDALLIRLKSPVAYRGTQCEFFIVSARHQGADLAAVASGGSVLCSFTQVPAQRARSATPFDLSWWRGGIGLIGSLTKM